MQLNVVSTSGGAGGSVDVADAVFAVEFKEPLIHQVVTAYLAGGRAGTHGQKTRSEVRGGGAKPWKQKGTGRARAGTIRSPLWRGGGKIFAAVTQDYSQKVNKKMYRGALRSILSELARQDRLLVVDQLDLAQPKTKQLTELLAKLGVGRGLLVTKELTANLALASRNLRHVDVAEADAVDPVSLVGFDKVVVTVDALKAIEENLA